MSDARFEAVAAGQYRVTGYVGFATATRLLAASQGAFDAPGSRVDIDLSGVDRADSAGLALLIEWLRQAKRRDKAIVFHSVPEQLRAIAHVSDLEDILPVEDPEENR